MSRAEVIEWIAILLAVAAIWPMSLGYLGGWPGWLRLAYYAVVVGAMVAVFVSRSARIRRTLRGGGEEGGRGR
jgi:hypothetical protein